jgi:hypothetical protein
MKGQEGRVGALAAEDASGGTQLSLARSNPANSVGATSNSAVFALANEEQGPRAATSCVPPPPAIGGQDSRPAFL